jgi:hypothetical protein
MAIPLRSIAIRLCGAFAPFRGANARVARLRQAARLARTALRREPVVRPDFLPRQS